MILASTGVLPTCLTRDSPASAAVTDVCHSKKSTGYVVIGGMEDKEEKQLMQLVMQLVCQLFAIKYCVLLHVDGFIH